MALHFPEFRAALESDPLNPRLHFELARQSLSIGDAALAFAELKTSRMLGMRSNEAISLESFLGERLPPKISLPHNQYFRFLTISNELRRLGGDDRYSVLDIGGGKGYLAQFIPDADYCLVEPSINGISGTRLPFANKSFDYVLACHVLEHIDPSERESFLDQLFAKARKAVVLLNPFNVAGVSSTERLKLVLDVTGADWAKEHLECTLPDIETVRAYAQSRGMRIRITPNGSLVTTLAMVFVDYFSRELGAIEKSQYINEFFNNRFCGIVDSEIYPNAYLITMTAHEGSQNQL